MLLMLLVNGSGHTAIHGVFIVIATAIAVRYGGLPTFLITTTGVCTCILMFTAVSVLSSHVDGPVRLALGRSPVATCQNQYALIGTALSAPIQP